MAARNQIIYIHGYNITQVLREETAMVNNFTSINKTNNILSPQITEYEKTRHMALEIRFPTNY
jgi:hypothetical protein